MAQIEISEDQNKIIVDAVIPGDKFKLEFIQHIHDRCSFCFFSGRICSEVPCSPFVETPRKDNKIGYFDFSIDNYQNL